MDIQAVHTKWTTQHEYWVGMAQQSSDAAFTTQYVSMSSIHERNAEIYRQKANLIQEFLDDLEAE